ncbi:MAG: T9SS type A sorting domain-containing protein [Candidatus Stygibacter australis]|nr:T9SS type A sorting domain-containing protein [Candidatus Stygibacter australis]MDP8321194.1 T9SS type A sorting domain-containing protein [Candidatus Stygibacter australis]
MKIYVVLLLIIISAILFAGMGNELELAKRNQLHSKYNVSRDFITLFSEDFENGAEGWETFDATGISHGIEFWHLSTTGAYEGNSWWMGDEELGGYTDHRYLVLNTPELILAEDNPELHFWFSLCCQDTGGGGAGYNAWDGANVRISTDGGENWSVLAGSPEYNEVSFFSFGVGFGEGQGVPGWGSTTEWVNWTEAVFNLDAYAGESVKIRFAFASDDNYNTADDASMFGFRLDDIAIDTATGIFESNGDGASGDSEMVAEYGATSTGDLWHIYEDSEAPSPTHAMGCFDEETDTYLPGMYNSITTPAFYLPANGNFFWDLDIKLMLDDDSTFPDCDYLMVKKCYQIPGEDWSNWYLISYPQGSPDIEGFAFTGNSETWVPFFPHWGLEYSNISEYAGCNVKLRFILLSNEENEVVPGGFKIDNFRVQQEIYFGPGPQNLIAVTNADQQVELSWDALSEGGGEGWIQWDNSVNDNAIGLDFGGTLHAAARFDTGDMRAYIGGEITQLEFYTGDLPEEMIIHIWSGPDAQNELVNQPYTPNENNWNLIDLDTPILIESNTEYWIGYEVTIDEFSNTAGADAGPAVIGKGDYFAFVPGNWEELSSYGLDYNWNIHAYIEAGERRLPLFPQNSREREITGYNIWRSTESGLDYQNIGACEMIDTPYFLDEEPIASSWNYYVVTALYDSVDGAFSNEARAYVLSDDAVELAYDDGSCEEGLYVGISQNMAVKFTPPANYTRSISQLNFYIETHDIGRTIFEILEGSTGLPGERIGLFIEEAENLHAGWNMVEFSPVSIPDYTSDCFFISIHYFSNLSAIGKDTDTAGNSWITTGGGHIWDEINDGNIMMRTYIYPYEGSDAIELAPASISISCYPNPFNPQTTISFFTTKGTENTEISIYNTKGQRIRSFIIHPDVIGTKSKINSIIWDGKDSQNRSCTTGVYFCRIKSGKQTATSKILLLK